LLRREQGTQRGYQVKAVEAACRRYLDDAGFTGNPLLARVSRE